MSKLWSTTNAYLPVQTTKRDQYTAFFVLGLFTYFELFHCYGRFNDLHMSCEVCVEFVDINIRSYLSIFSSDLLRFWAWRRHILSRKTGKLEVGEEACFVLHTVPRILAVPEVLPVSRVLKPEAISLVSVWNWSSIGFNSFPVHDDSTNSWQWLLVLDGLNGVTVECTTKGFSIIG